VRRYAFAVPDDATILHFYNPFRGRRFGADANIGNLLINSKGNLLMFANPWYKTHVEKWRAFPSIGYVAKTMSLAHYDTVTQRQ